MVTAFRNIVLALLILSLLPNNTVAETEKNVTLNDSVVILLDDSCGTNLWQHRSSVDFIDFSDVINVDSNISIITYGYSNSTFNNFNSDYLDLIIFLQSIVTYPSPLPRCDNIYQAFNDAKDILDNATGSKQIILISDGNIDGKYGLTQKLDNVRLIDLINGIKKDNITINFYQVLDANESIRDISDIMKPYSDLGKGTTTDIILLNGNGSERLHFINRKTEKPLIYGKEGEYSDELFGNNETALIVNTTTYQKNPFETYIVDFYRNCDEYDCIVIPIGRNGEIFDNEQMSEIFRGKDAIDMVKSGKIIESAYLVSNPTADLICGYYDSETLKEEAKNAAVLVIEKSSDKSEIKKIRTIKRVLDVKKLNVVSLIISSECEISTLDDLQKKIMDGGEFTYNLRNGLYAYGYINAFKNYNDDLIKLINERNNDVVRAIIYFFNTPIYYEAKPLLEANSNQLSKLRAIDYSERVDLATKQIKNKEKESDDLIDSADRQLKVLDKNLKEIQNENEYSSQARQKSNEAAKYLNDARENRKIYKFNTAILKANESNKTAIDGIRYLGESKNRPTPTINRPIPTISIAMSITAFIIVAILIKRKKSN